MTTPREAFKIDQYHPGSDLAGETAAALASASIAFKPYNSSYSNLLLVHAKQVCQLFANRLLPVRYISNQFLSCLLVDIAACFLTNG